MGVQWLEGLSISIPTSGVHMETRDLKQNQTGILGP